MFAPKLLALGATLATGASAFGGRPRLLLSAVLEPLFGLLLGPVLTMFYLLFVATTLMGRVVHWDAQPRDDRGLSWPEATRRFALPLLAGTSFVPALAATGTAWSWAPMLPGLLLGIPLAVWSSRRSLGSAARRHRLFLTPEETRPAPEITALHA